MCLSCAQQSDFDVRSSSFELDSSFEFRHSGFAGPLAHGRLRFRKLLIGNVHLQIHRRRLDMHHGHHGCSLHRGRLRQRLHPRPAPRSRRLSRLGQAYPHGPQEQPRRREAGSKVGADGEVVDGIAGEGKAGFERELIERQMGLRTAIAEASARKYGIIR